MINLTDPVLPDPRPEETRRKIGVAAMNAGSIARRLGLKLEDCPPYRIAELEEKWRMGWFRGIKRGR